jgi:outer membrane protein assembly factor BamB
MRRNQHLLFVGIRDQVIALDPKDGSEMWRTKVAGGMGGFVNVMWDGETVIAASNGEVYRLDPRSGEIVWHNKLKGLGLGFVTLASTRQPAVSGNVTAAQAAVHAQPDGGQ